MPAVQGLPKAAWVNWVQASAFDTATAYAAFDLHTFGDMAPYVYRTRDYGKTWEPLVSPVDAKGVRGYAHVIKEDPKSRNLLYLGTEFGLYISMDGGRQWARFKGGRMPDVAVRDIAIQPRTNDLVLATHGRGIWIVDDITPLRALSREILSSEQAFVTSPSAFQRLRASGGWANGDAVFTGDNPKDGAVITFYQRSRHLYGQLKLEVFDAGGKRVADLPAARRPGLNRVVWNMLEKPPRVPPAVQLADAGTQGPRVLPGVYTVRLTNNGKAIETHLVVGLEPRATFTLADRQAQHSAAVRVGELFRDETALMKRLLALRSEIAQRGTMRTENDSVQEQLMGFDQRVDALRQKIVATTEGGAITGEERLREHTDQLYGALLTHEGRPTAYQLSNIDVLRAEFKKVNEEFERLVGLDLATLNRSLLTAGKSAISVLPEDDGDEDDEDFGSSNPTVGSADPDARASPASLPVGFRPMR